MISISIITPSFNQANWLKLCVASVADQPTPSGERRFSVEHIVQDGMSQDIGTIRELVNHQNSVTESANYSLSLFSEPDSGMYDAVNLGLRRSHGDIISYLNCDEQYLPGTLSAITDFFSKNPDIEMVFGDSILVDSAGNPLSYRRSVLPSSYHTRLCHLGTLTCSTFFRRTVLERGIYFDPNWKAIGDSVWIDTCIAKKVKMATFPIPLATFAFTGCNLSETQSRGNNSEQERWLKTLSWPPSGLRLPISTIHRVRKFLAGAYRRRNLDYSIYTFDTPHKRREFSAKNVGSGWPSSNGSE